MSSLFIDTNTRRQFIEGLVQVIAEIFAVTDDVTKSSLYNELTTLSDEELIRKQELIESYYKSTINNSKLYIQNLQLIENRLKEYDEKSNVAQPFIS